MLYIVNFEILQTVVGLLASLVRGVGVSSVNAEIKERSRNAACRGKGSNLTVTGCVRAHIPVLVLAPGECAAS